MLYTTGNIGDLSTFTAGVVGEGGTVYFVKITDINAFTTFLGSLTEADITQFNYDLEGYYTLGICERGFLEIFKSAGIALFKGQVTNLGNMNKRNLNSSSSVVNSNC